MTNLLTRLRITFLTSTSVNLELKLKYFNGGIPLILMKLLFSQSIQGTSIMSITHLIKSEQDLFMQMFLAVLPIRLLKKAFKLNMSVFQVLSKPYSQTVNTFNITSMKTHTPAQNALRTMTLLPWSMVVLFATRQLLKTVNSTRQSQTLAMNVTDVKVPWP